MNVAFYVTAFDQASGAFMRNMGLGRRYVDGKLGMTFVLETHVTYDREMRGGAPMRFTTQLLDRDAKQRAPVPRDVPRRARATSPRPTRRS